MTEVKPVTTREETTTEIIRQLVCFRLGDEIFGIDIYKVQEINRMVAITKIPQSPHFVEGVINLRGKIIPVIDLKKRFGMEAGAQRTKENRIIVIQTGGVTVGFIVDEVTEVLRIPATKIEETPEMVTAGVEQKYIEGVALLDSEHLLIVLDMDKIFSREETASITSLAD